MSTENSEKSSLLFLESSGFFRSIPNNFPFYTFVDDRCRKQRCTIPNTAAPSPFRIQNHRLASPSHRPHLAGGAFAAKKSSFRCSFSGAGDRSRTGTMSPSADFESVGLFGIQ